VQLDFWGAFYANPNNRTTIQNDAANVFGGSPGSSRFWAKTAEYGANLGFLGSVANNKGTTDGAGFTKASIEAGIRSDIANHSIIGGTSGAVVVVLPTDSTYRDSSGAAECAGCGHHDSFINPDTNQRVNYATVSTSTDEKQTMYALSHEVAEIATDPDQSGFWAPQVPGSTRNGTLENGDLCQNMRDTVNGSPSALTWSQAYCGCL
jgi:hypothetical protein